MGSMPPSPHRVAVLLIEPVIGFDAAIAPMLFGAATTAGRAPLYDVVTCGLTSDPVAATTGYAMIPAAGPEVLAGADTVVIPGTKYPPARIEGRLGDEVRQALSLIPPTARMVSICTGAFVLAAAGILDDRPATTHWQHADTFRALFPRVALDQDVLFVDDGDVLTSAGLAAGIDLCLHLIRRDHGTQIANAVARYCVVPPWREGGQAQFIQNPLPAEDFASTAATRAWACENLAESLSIRRLAQHAGMSPRTFIRRFREETGQPPGEWVRNRRIDRARELLEGHDLSVEEVAQLSGLGSGGNLRHHLRRGLGMSPSSYRKVFAG